MNKFEVIALLIVVVGHTSCGKAITISTKEQNG